MPQQQQAQQQQQHLTVPNTGVAYLRPNLSPPQPVMLAPPDASQLAQRRFSEVDAAIDRHNLRRQVRGQINYCRITDSQNGDFKKVVIKMLTSLA
jgi:hypothetical protein